MTSRISFSKMVQTEWKQFSWLMAIQAVVFVMLIPFRLLMVLAVRAANSAQTLTSVEKLEIFCHNMGLGRIENIPFILGAAIVCALCVFGYVHSAVKLDFYHSLAVKREQLFAVKYISSVLTFVIPYLAAQILGVMVGTLYHAVSRAAVLEVALASLQGILFFLCSYAGTLTAIMLTGKFMTTVCALGVFLVYGPMLYLLRIFMSEVFLVTEISNYTADERMVLQCTSPWAFCLFWTSGQKGGEGVTGLLPNMAGMCQLIAIAALLTVFSVSLYRHRKTEAAGSAIAFSRLEGVIKILLAVPAALVAAMAAYAAVESVFWAIVFTILFGILGCLIMEFIYRWDIRQVLQHKCHIVITVVAAVLIFLGFYFDVIGYNRRLPAQDEIASMAVADTWNEFGFDDRSYADRSSLDEREVTEFDPIYAMAENGVENVKQYGRTIYYGDSVGEYTYSVSIKYHLKNGTSIYRLYQVDDAVYEKNMELLKQNDTFMENNYSILSWTADQLRAVYGTVYPGDIPELDPENAADQKDDEQSGSENADEAADETEQYLNIEVTGENVGKLLAAYQKDIRMLSASEIRDALGGLSFEMSARNKQEESIYYHVPFGKAFINTIQAISPSDVTKIEY